MSNYRFISLAGARRMRLKVKHLLDSLKSCKSGLRTTETEQICREMSSLKRSCSLLGETYNSLAPEWMELIIQESGDEQTEVEVYNQARSKRTGTPRAQSRWSIQVAIYCHVPSRGPLELKLMLRVVSSFFSLAAGCEPNLSSTIWLADNQPERPSVSN